MSNIVQYSHLPAEFRSTYLDEAFPAEKLVIQNVLIDIENKKVSGLVSVKTDPSMFPDPAKYWWPANTGYRAATQLAIGFGCELTNKTKADIGEVLQLESHLYSRKPLVGTNDKLFDVEFTRLLQKGNHIMGDMAYVVDNSTFAGKIRFAVGFK